MHTQECSLTEEALHRQIGEINVVFQYLENELLEIEWFCTEAEALKPGRRFVDIIKDARGTVNAYLDRANVPQGAPVRRRFAQAFADVREASKQRNLTVHSTYYWHESFQGSPSLTRTFAQRDKNGTVERKTQPVTPQTVESASELVNSVFEEFFALHRVLMYELPSTLTVQ